MGWATFHIEQLKKGETVKFVAAGKSMQGVIENGTLVTVEPITDLSTVEIGEIVLCTVNRFDFLHVVKGMSGDGQFLIGNNKGRTNGWTKNVYGRMVPRKNSA